jgi:hypothetical protein
LGKLYRDMAEALHTKTILWVSVQWKIVKEVKLKQWALFFYLKIFQILEGTILDKNIDYYNYPIYCVFISNTKQPNWNGDSLLWFDHTIESENGTLLIIPPYITAFQFLSPDQSQQLILASWEKIYEQTFLYTTQQELLSIITWCDTFENHKNWLVTINNILTQFLNNQSEEN